MTILRKILVGLVVAALVLPIVICVVLGVARLLAAMQDAAGAAALDRIALGVAILWVLDLIALLIALGVNVVAAPIEPPGDEER